MWRRREEGGRGGASRQELSPETDARGKPTNCLPHTRHDSGTEQYTGTLQERAAGQADGAVTVTATGARGARGGGRRVQSGYDDNRISINDRGDAINSQFSRCYSTAQHEPTGRVSRPRWRCERRRRERSQDGRGDEQRNGRCAGRKYYFGTLPLYCYSMMYAVCTGLYMQLRCTVRYGYRVRWVSTYLKLGGYS